MFGTIDVKARPLKLGFLVNPNRASQVRHAIQLASSMWGGMYFPIISIYGKIPRRWREDGMRTSKAQDVISGYVDAYDPDILVQVTSDVPHYIASLGIRVIKPDEIWRTSARGSRHLPRFGIGIFEILKEVFHEHFRFTSKYPVKVAFPRLPREHALFWASVFGELPPSLVSNLKQNYAKPLEIDFNHLDVSSFSRLLDGDVLFPRRIVSHKIEVSGRAGFGRDACLFFMDADKTDDIIDYWNLRAMGREVVPVPRQYQDAPALRELVIDFLKKHRRPWPHDKNHCNHASAIRSRHRTMEEMQKWAGAIELRPAKSDPSADPFVSLQHWYPRVWDEWARDKDGAVPVSIFADEESIEVSETNSLDVRFQSVVPEFADEHAYSSEPRCANEVSFRLYGEKEYLADVFPKASGSNFIHAISRPVSFGDDWRIGRNGLVNLVKGRHSQHWRIPRSSDLFFAWLKDNGWSAKASAPGLLAAQIYKRLDGMPTVLANELILKLIEHMNGGAVTLSGASAARTEGDLVVERAIPVGAIKSRLLEISNNSNIHDYLLSREIFKVGLELQCPTCIRRSWFSPDDLGASLTCPKCLAIFPALGNISNGKWCYKTAGPFSVPRYAEGAYSVLLGLNLFNKRRMHSLQISPVFSFTAEASDGTTIEADFAGFWRQGRFGEIQDGVIFAECKSYNEFRKTDFDRMELLARTFPGAVLAFCTLRKALKPDELSGIGRISKKGRKYWKSDRPVNPVLILTGTELLSNMVPPNCWESPTKEKFLRLDGLIDLCEATQQIYLGLPSWHDTWKSAWDRRDERRRSRAQRKDGPSS